MKAGTRLSFDESSPVDEKGRHVYYVYILSSKTRVLYIGVTNDIGTRLAQHRAPSNPGFTGRYNCHSLVHFERFRYIDQAIAREKQLKGWTRKRKLALIQEKNPMWMDLSEDWGKDFEDLSAEYFRYSEE